MASLPQLGISDADAMATGLALEGRGSIAAGITNTAYTPAYKVIRNRFNIESWAKAARLAKSAMNEAVDLGSLEILKKMDAEGGADWVLARVNGNVGVALASILLNTVYACVDRIHSVCRANDLSTPKKVAITGGWAENNLVRDLLCKRGMEPVVPRHAATATHAGVAAEALRRLMLAQGESISFREALEALPEP